MRCYTELLKAVDLTHVTQERLPFQVGEGLRIFVRAREPFNL